MVSRQRVPLVAGAVVAPSGVSAEVVTFSILLTALIYICELKHEKNTEHNDHMQQVYSKEFKTFPWMSSYFVCCFEDLR